VSVREDTPGSPVLISLMLFLGDPGQGGSSLLHPPFPSLTVVHVEEGEREPTMNPRGTGVEP